MVIKLFIASIQSIPAEFSEGRHHLIDIRSGNIQMSDHAHPWRSGELDPALGAEGLQRAGLLANLGVDHIGLHWLHRIAQLTQAGSQTFGIGVILGQALHLMLQRIQASRGEHAGLAHTAADHFAQTPRPADQLG